jgi:hypothetical protein
LRVIRYIRAHHIGLVALFVALTGTAYAGTQIVGDQADSQAAKAKKKKKGKRGPAGPQGPKGDTGPPGDPAASVNTGIIQTFSFGTYFGAPSGASGSSDEDTVSTLTPAGAPITARDLSVSVPDPLPAGRVASAALRVNGVESALTCAIPVGSRTCQDSSHAVTIPPNSHISVRTTLNGTGASSGELWSFGWRAVP